MISKTIAVALVLMLAVAGWLSYRSGSATGSAPIRVGVLHSLTGTMAISERAVVDAALLAIVEINAKGGVLGRRVEAVVAARPPSSRAPAHLQDDRRSAWREDLAESEEGKGSTFTFTLPMASA